VNVDYEPTTTDVRQDFVSLGTRLTQERRGELFDRWYHAAREDAREQVYRGIRVLHHAVTGPGRFYGDKDGQVCADCRQGWPCNTVLSIPASHDARPGDDHD